jgi:di/tricarboxylate transporter
VDIKDYLTEARLPEKGPLAGKTVADLRKPGDGEVEVVAILRDGERRRAPLPDASLRAGDILLLRGEPKALERVVAEGGLELVGQHRSTQREGSLDPARTGEAIVTQGSLLEGLSAAEIDLHARFHINLLGISRAGERFTERLRDIRLRAGDVVLLQGDEDLLPERLRELGLLPLAARSLALGSTRRRFVTGSIVAATVIIVALGLLPVAIAFFAAAVALLALRALTLRDAYESVEAPILVMLAALIPVSDSLRVTGATDVFAGLLAQVGAGLPGWGAVGLMLIAAMAVTPFLNNAATVLVMAPIGAGFAKTLGYNPDAFLMAVAIGAACDFLTPIGHQCNTLVMGPGGYRFGDYARLGAPLSALVILLAVPLILFFWPLR